MSLTEYIAGYKWSDADPTDAHRVLLPAVLRILGGLAVEKKRIFEVGCGNGSVANELMRKGCEVTGVDPSVEGIAQAKQAYPGLDLHLGSAYDDLAAQYGTFPVVLSLEVVEHVYAPSDYAKTVYSLLQPGGWRLSPCPIMGIGRTWQWRSPVKWMCTSLRYGTTGTSSSGR